MKKKTHRFKIMEQSFKTVLDGSKIVILKANKYQITVGDRLELLECVIIHEPHSLFESYSGRRCFRTVKRIVDSFSGIKPGYCALEIK